MGWDRQTCSWKTDPLSWRGSLFGSSTALPDATTLALLHHLQSTKAQIHHFILLWFGGVGVGVLIRLVKCIDWSASRNDQYASFTLLFPITHNLKMLLKQAANKKLQTDGYYRLMILWIQAQEPPKVLESYGVICVCFNVVLKRIIDWVCWTNSCLV